ncbi:MAG: DNA-protecting protein DprA [Planctomycetaceae bacterium]|jgi:DNA processing protein|nr:DNA-protecting protein DprA [Planctomycetaceae bacterium]
MSDIIPLQLMLARGVGDVFIRRFADFVARYGESAGDEILHSVEEMVLTFRLKSDVAESIVNVRNDAELLLRRLSDSCIGVVWLADEHYPHRLKFVLGKDAPPILFYRGNFHLCEEPTVGFCGSRAVSEKGLVITEQCVHQLVPHGIVVVSGYAQGVDITSHRVALQRSGKTIFVLAEGLFHFHEKKEIRDFLDSDNYLIFSQFAPDTIWRGRNAMCRNSVIIGLSDAMILVESGLDGGTYAAGNECLCRNHPLWVIDYATPPCTAKANSEFIGRGGLPIRSKSGEPNLERILSTVKKSN